jgi:hypothetical protein
MPEVNGKKFPYTAKGMKDAEKEKERLSRDRTRGLDPEFSQSVMDANRKREEEGMKRIQKEMGMAYGGKVKKMKSGGMCRGMGKASKGGRYSRA